jgi:hypothetical protein
VGRRIAQNKVENGVFERGPIKNMAARPGSRSSKSAGKRYCARARACSPLRTGAPKTRAAAPADSVTTVVFEQFS